MNLFAFETPRVVTEASQWLSYEVVPRCADKIDCLLAKIGAVARDVFREIAGTFQPFYNTVTSSVKSYCYRKLSPFTNIDVDTFLREADLAQKMRIPQLSENFRLQFQPLSGLDGIDICHKNANIDKWVVYFLSENDFWQKDEVLLKLSTIASEAKVNVRVSNYAFRDAPVERDLIDGGRQLVESLIKDKSVAPNKILVHGESCGAAIAANIVMSFDAEHIHLKLCHERSFTSLDELYRSKLATIGTVFGKIKAYFGWRLDSMPAASLGKRLVVIYHPKDPEITKSAQFAAVLDRNNHTDSEKIILSEEEFHVDGHRRMWFDDEYKRYAEVCQAGLFD